MMYLLVIVGLVVILPPILAMYLKRLGKALDLALNSALKECRPETTAILPYEIEVPAFSTVGEIHMNGRAGHPALDDDRDNA